MSNEKQWAAIVHHALIAKQLGHECTPESIVETLKQRHEPFDIALTVADVKEALYWCKNTCDELLDEIKRG